MDHRAKLQWARNHFGTLDQAVDAFIKNEPYKLSVKFDAQEDAYIAWLTEVTDMPAEWRLMLGDIIQNTRSALDALTYALACKNLGGPPSDRQVIQIQFVIVDDPGNWPGECGRRLSCLHPDAVTVIHGLQPCHRTDRTKRHALSVLRDLSNVDKHRHIVLALAAAASSGITITHPAIPGGTEVVDGYVGPIEKDTMVARWQYVAGGRPIPNIFHPDVDAHGKLGLDVQFPSGWPAYGGSVLGFLPNLLDFIETRVFPPLEALL
ncbi:MAG TPA: hypothetical protein VHE78_04080 [Gemmatimonadaceae bacterium]|nr:hypothetical protein [Gemmatimonadaceae bacterium]